MLLHHFRASRGLNPPMQIIKLFFVRSFYAYSFFHWKHFVFFFFTFFLWFWWLDVINKEAFWCLGKLLPLYFLFRGSCLQCLKIPMVTILEFSLFFWLVDIISLWTLGLSHSHSIQCVIVLFLNDPGQQDLKWHLFFLSVLLYGIT